MVKARNLSKRYDTRRIFDKVDVDLAAGGFLLVTGPNGSGKTTLLRVLAGLAAPTSGELELPMRGEIGYLGHDPLVYKQLTPLENLTLFARLYRVSDREQRIRALLERFGLWDVRDKAVATFSRGMQQRLGLGRVLLHDPKLLILDEPFNALDTAGASLLDEELATRSHRAVVVATHDPERVEGLATERLAFT